MPEKTAPKNLLSFAEKNFRPLVFVLSGFFLFGSGMLLAKAWKFRNPPPIEYKLSENVLESDAASRIPSKEIKKIKIDVSGAVKSPGVYELDEDSRVEDAISSSGGFSDDVDQNWISRDLNRAATLSDGEKIYIPKKGEVAGSKVGGQVSGSQEIGGGGVIITEDAAPGCPEKININTAPASQLECLYNIGKGRAQEIINYRSSNQFDSIEEIMEVKGIGEKTFEKIKDRIVVQ